MLRAFAIGGVALALLLSAQVKAPQTQARHTHQTVVQDIQAGAVVGVEGQASR